MLMTCRSLCNKGPD